MGTDPRTSESLQTVVRRAVAGVPGARRGSLLVRDGDQIVYRAAIGLEDIVSGSWHLPARAGTNDISALLARSGAASADGLRLTRAVDWYRAHLPGLAASVDSLAADTGLALLPIHAYGKLSGVLAIEVAATAPPVPPESALLELLADVAGATLERDEARDEMVRSTHELDLIQSLLSVVASSIDLHDLERLLGDGLKRVQPHAGWTCVELIMTASTTADDRAGRGDVAALAERRQSTFDTAVARALNRSETVVTELPENEGERAGESSAAGRWRTRVVVPLLGQDAVLGALALESEAPRACAARELTLIERLAGIVAVLVENAQLISRVIERSRALEEMSRQHEDLLHTVQMLSSPVVPIARDILVVPVIGVVDERRAGRFLESMLDAIYEHAARVVLIDVTGMVLEDARSLNHLEKAARAARLLGVEVALVGMSARIANTMVTQHVDLSGIITCSSLEFGLAHALARTRARIVGVSC